MQWYYNILVRRPYLMVLFMSVLSVTCIIVSFTKINLLDFSDPSLGFESRGTAISKRLVAFHNLLQETGPSSLLVVDPNDLTIDENKFDSNNYPVKSRKNKKRKNRKKENKRKQKRKENKKKSKKLKKFKEKKDSSENSTEILPEAVKWHGDNGVFKGYETINNSLLSSHDFIVLSDHEIAYGRNMTFVDEDDERDRIDAKKSTWSSLMNGNISEKIRLPIEGYFCDSPVNGYSHFVVERIGSNSTNSLFDLDGLLAMCQLQEQITKVTNYGEYCQREMISNKCCRPWSLPNYAALLANKSSCFDLTRKDVQQLQNLLSSCFEYFHDLKLSNDCSEVKKCYAPTDCTQNNLVFNILNFLTDINFIKINDTNMHLKYSMIFVPIPHTMDILPLFHEWEKTTLHNEIVRVAAMDLGLENELFNELLLTDTWLVALGAAFIMACMWLYTTSIFLTLMTCIAVIFSLGLAYFIYALVFQMSFFPYMNLLAVVVIVGIGADDAFIFVKIWQCIVTEKFSKMSTITTKTLTDVSDSGQTETLYDVMAVTFKHAAISMLVTSLTTAVAFYASYTSSITSIKCFGIFSGTVVLANYFLMITWLPASITIMDRISTYKTCRLLQAQKLLTIYNKSINNICSKFQVLITTAVMDYAYLWLSLFGVLGLGSAYVLLYKPGLQLPESSYFPLFVPSHPFEVYNSKFKNEFWFEKSIMNYENYKFSLRFVWGIEAIDDGDYSNPFSYGTIHYDNNFNVSTKASQLWMLSFCRNMRQQPFYQLTFGMLLMNCFIENFITLMDRVCVNEMDYTDRTPCCDISKFPYEPDVFNLCLPQIISSLYATPREFFSPGIAGPRFMASPATSDQNVSSSMNEDVFNTTLDNQPHSSEAPPVVKALIIEFESNVSYSNVFKTVTDFINSVEEWFQNELKSAPPEMQNGWFISELKFYDVQNTLISGTLAAIVVAMTASFVVILVVTLNILISLYAVITVLFTICTTVAILILLGWKLNLLESIAVSTAIGLAVDFSLHYGIHYRLSPSCERLAATKFSLSRIVSPTAMATITTGIAGCLMLFSKVLPYLQIGVFLLVVMSVSWCYATFFLMSLLKLYGPQYGFMQFKYPRVKAFSNTSSNKFYERKQNQVTREQLLTPSTSVVGELINSEIHELESLTQNSMVKTICGTKCSVQDFPLGMNYENLFSAGKHPVRSITSPITSHHHKCPEFLKENSREENLPITTIAAEPEDAPNQKLMDHLN